jgi:hypothetical protein
MQSSVLKRNKVVSKAAHQILFYNFSFSICFLITCRHDISKTVVNVFIDFFVKKIGKFNHLFALFHYLDELRIVIGLNA